MVGVDKAVTETKKCRALLQHSKQARKIDLRASLILGAARFSQFVQLFDSFLCIAAPHAQR